VAAKVSFDQPDDALRALADRLETVQIESGEADLRDRVLAESVTADRDSPAADVSAMDGYAVRMRDLADGSELPVAGESVPGAAPPPMPPRGVVRIFTGAVIPSGCEAVVKREDTVENSHVIGWRGEAPAVRPGENIRRAGENVSRGETVLAAGRRLSAADVAVITSFGRRAADLYRHVRVAVVTTGGELVDNAAAPEPWQLRNSNRSALTSIVANHRWLQTAASAHVADDRDELRRTLSEQLATADAVILTGGVSMGDYDFVPETVGDVGGEIVFHKLPIRPGKPILGAATGDGKLILGLPGNPVSATIGCVRFALPLLARMSGQTDWLPPRPAVRLEEGGDRTLPLRWMRPVRLVGDGVARPVGSKGSGDLVSLTRSSGFVELPPGGSGPGPWPYYSW